MAGIILNLSLVYADMQAYELEIAEWLQLQLAVIGVLGMVKTRGGRDARAVEWF